MKIVNLLILSISSENGNTNLANIRGDLTAGDPGVDALGRHLRLELAHVRLAEEELPVQVGQVDRVHVDHVDVPEAHHGEVLEKLAAQTAGADDEDLEDNDEDGDVDEDLDVLQEEGKEVGRGSELGWGEGATALQDPCVQCAVCSVQCAVCTSSTMCALR